MNMCDVFDDLLDFAELSNQPDRSRLFSLVPMRLGKPMQESLRSFLIRTSRAHAVNPRRLVMEILSEVDPEIGAFTSSGFFRRFSKTINGMGQYAERFVSVLEKATCVAGLDRLTMLPWRGMFPHNGQGMLAEHPQWCSACLFTQCLEDGERYIPLAWALEGFTVCPIHERRLEQHCPYCGKHQSFIPRYPDVGICSECGEPLVTHDVLTNRDTAQSTDFERWMADAISGMIVCQASRSFVPTACDFRAFVEAQVSRVAGGNRAAFCRIIGLQSRALNGWLAKDERPSMSQLLEFCRRLKICPADIVQGESHSVDFPLLPTSTSMKPRASCPRLSARRRQEIRSLLVTFLSDSDCEPPSRIAAKIGVSARYLRYWFPDLCRELSIRHRTAQKIKSASYQAKQGGRVREVVRQIIYEGKYPSRRQVNRILSKEGMSLAQPHLLAAYLDTIAN